MRNGRNGLVLTEEEFYSQEGEDSPYQYLGGGLVVCEPVSYRHEDICLFLSGLLRIFLEERGGAVAVGSHYPMRLDPRWSPEPDLLVVLDRNRPRLGPQRLEGPADLLIEIASPGDARRALRLKLPRYRQAGVPEIWVVDPDARLLRAEILRPPESRTPTGGAAAAGEPSGSAARRYRTRLLKAGRLDSTVVPGFWLDVSWLWQRPLPPTLACVRQILS